MSGIFKSIQPKDVRVTPYRAHKTVIASFDGNESSSFCKVYQAENSLSSSYNFVEVATTNLDAGNLHPEFEPQFARTTDGYFKTAVHAQIDHLFYKRYVENNRSTLGGGNINFQYRDLGYKAKVISLPNKTIGEGVLQGSLAITASGYTIEDDKNGNLVIKTGPGLTSPDPCDYDNLMLSYTFNTFYKYVGEGPVSVNLPVTYGSTRLYAQLDNISFVRADANSTIATSFDPPNNSVIKLIPAEDQSFRSVYNFTSKNYAISLGLKLTSTPSSDVSLLTKQDLRDDFAVNLAGQVYIENNVPNQYPYKLEITSARKIKFTKSDSVTTLSVTSNTALTLNADNDIVLQRSGSMIELYINGVKDSNFSNVVDTFYNSNHCDSDDTACANDSILRLGNDYSLTKGIEGDISYFHVFDRNLTQNEITDLNQTDGTLARFCGNVFYNLGLIVITHPKLVNTALTRLVAKATVSLLETEVYCTVGPNEFSTTHNRTVHTWNPVTNQYEIGCEFLVPEFRPYITTIGLYDDSYNLVAVAKLSTPIQTSRTTDTTFIVRFDR